MTDVDFGIESALSLSIVAATVSEESNARLRSGKEELLLLLGSSKCGASKNPPFNLAFSKIRKELKRRAHAEGTRFSVVGVACDSDITAGRRFLEELGPFDQEIVGGSWLNPAFISFVWRDHPGCAVLPQLLVIERNITIGEPIKVGEDVILARICGLARIYGLSEIINWADRRAWVQSINENHKEPLRRGEQADEKQCGAARLSRANSRARGLR